QLASHGVRLRDAKSRLKGLLRVRPERLGLGEAGLARRREGNQPLTAIRWIDPHFDEAVPLERLQRVRKRTWVHDKRFGKLAHRPRKRPADLSHDTSLIDRQATGQKSHIVKLAD